MIENLPTGEYTVVASFMGYEPSSRRVTLTDAEPVKTLGPMSLSATTAQMDGATVSAERPFVTTEGSKTVYNFEESQVALAGKSAVDVLQDLPSLRIDAMDGSIRLRGNQSVAIHVNGEPVSLNGKALVQYLNSFSGEDVKRVEVNTNPSARHDAEGTAGIVNIVLDRMEERGLSGGFSGSAGGGPQLDGSGHLGYDRGPWTLYGSYSYSHNEREIVQTLLRRPSVGVQPVLDQSTTQQQTYGGHSFNAEIEYARRKTNAIEWTTVQDDSLTIRTYDNYDARTTYGTELTSSLTVGDAEATLSGNLYHRRTSGSSLGADARDAFAFMGRANVTWALLDGLRLQMSQMYRSPVTTGLGRIDPFVRTSASLERTFWDDKGTLGLQVKDPFNTSEIGLRKQTDTVQERLRRDWDGRSVSVSFSYRFGD